MLGTPFIDNNAFPPLMFSTYEKPKFYDYLPETYKMKWEDPHLFLPLKLLPHFNQKIYLNFVHRECFNSCVEKSTRLTEVEKTCYTNCKNKHLNVIGTFKDVLMAKRKWQGWKNFVSLKEYSRQPEEMGTTVPTDPMLKGEYLKHKNRKEALKAFTGLVDLFATKKDEKEITIFDAYMTGIYAKDSELGKQKKEGERKDIYNEYKELNEKYGDKVKEIVKQKVNMNDWKDVPGSNFVPEEEEPVAASSVEEDVASLDRPEDE